MSKLKSDIKQLHSMEPGELAFYVECNRLAIKHGYATYGERPFAALRKKNYKLSEELIEQANEFVDKLIDENNLNTDVKYWLNELYVALKASDYCNRASRRAKRAW